MKALKWINTIAFLAMVGVNVAANIIPIGGNTTGEVSQAYPNLFTPAPVTFGIWGVIYLLMLVFVLFQWGFIGNRVFSGPIREEIGVAFAISCILNIAWIISWHFRQIELSTFIIVLLLVCLIVITKRIDRLNGSFMTHLMVNVGFDIYFGWIIAATIANVSVMLTKLEWNGWGVSENIWTIIVLIVGALIGCGVVVVSNKYFSGLAIIWAYIGIIIKHLSRNGYNGKYMAIVLVAAIGIVLIMGSGVYRLFVPNSRMGIKSCLE